MRLKIPLFSIILFLLIVGYFTTDRPGNYEATLLVTILFLLPALFFKESELARHELLFFIVNCAVATFLSIPWIFAMFRMQADFLGFQRVGHYGFHHGTFGLLMQYFAALYWKEQKSYDFSDASRRKNFLLLYAFGSIYAGWIFLLDDFINEQLYPVIGVSSPFVVSLDIATNLVKILFQVFIVSALTLISLEVFKRYNI